MQVNETEDERCDPFVGFIKRISGSFEPFNLNRSFCADGAISETLQVRAVLEADYIAAPSFDS